MKLNYQILADYLSDHLWQRNSLDYDFLKMFPEFMYKGKAYRVHFLEKHIEPECCIHRSFSKSKAGLKEYIYNAENYDKDFVRGKIPYVYECEIEGFDIHLSLCYFKKHGGLTEKTISAFINEEEVIAFSHSPLIKIEFE